MQSSVSGEFRVEWRIVKYEGTSNYQIPDTNAGT